MHTYVVGKFKHWQEELHIFQHFPLIPTINKFTKAMPHGLLTFFRFQKSSCLLVQVLARLTLVYKKNFVFLPLRKLLQHFFFFFFSLQTLNSGILLICFLNFFFSLFFMNLVFFVLSIFGLSWSSTFKFLQTLSSLFQLHLVVHFQIQNCHHNYMKYYNENHIGCFHFALS